MLKQYRENKPHLSVKKGVWYAAFTGKYSVPVGDLQNAMLYAGLR